MPKTEKQHKDIIKRLDGIQTLLQNLVIIEGAAGGLTRDDVCGLAGVGPARVSKVWKNLKSKQEK